jgi:hypothetical protein
MSTFVGRVNNDKNEHHVNVAAGLRVRLHPGEQELRKSYITQQELCNEKKNLFKKIN